MVIVICSGLLLAGFLWWSRKSIKTTTYEYSSCRLPLSGITIVHLSDLQSEYFGKAQGQLLRKVSEAEPDLILFTGDLADRNHTDYEAGLTLMAGLVKTAPVYYVDGNHELALPVSDISQMYDAMAGLGVHLLRDKGETVCCKGIRLRLLGLSEETLYRAKVSGGALEEGQKSSRGKVSDTDIDAKLIKDGIAELLSEEEGQLTMLLVHEPQFLDVYASPGIDLIFAGHAHGGQIRLPFTEGLFAPGQGVLPKLTRGMHRSGNSTMVISRGLGNSTFPFRVFNRPEIVVCRLRCAEE